MVLAMKITIEIPDEHIHDTLLYPHYNYWTNECKWDSVTCTGYVIDVEEDDEPIIELDASDLVKAFDILHKQYPKTFARFLSGDTDGVDGDSLLQLMAFGELKYG
jgi:hypothetical protein